LQVLLITRFLQHEHHLGRSINQVRNFLVCLFFVTGAILFRFPFYIHSITNWKEVFCRTLGGF